MVNFSLKVEEPSENCRTMAGVTDWTERHRPSSERQLEGNEVQRRKIRAWLDEWKNGNPRKKALLLVGPPGVGKRRWHERLHKTWVGMSSNSMPQMPETLQRFARSQRTAQLTVHCFIIRMRRSNELSFYSMKLTTSLED